MSPSKTMKPFFPVLLVAAYGILSTTAVDEAAAIKVTDFYRSVWAGECSTGTNLSPINVRDVKPAPPEWPTKLNFSPITGLALYNTGHAMKVQWNPFAPTTFTDPTRSTTVAVAGDHVSAIFSTPGPIRQVKVVPLQMHWHSPSEHTVNGTYYAAEGHLVTAIAKGEATEWGCDAFWVDEDADKLVLDKCLSVFGVLYKVGDTTPPPLSAMLDTFKTSGLEVGSTTDFPGTIDFLKEMYPTNLGYSTYRGALTTPPCSQGVRWHLFSEPMTITEDDLEKMERNQAESYVLVDKPGGAPEKVEVKYRTNHNYLQDIHDRTVYQVGMTAGQLEAKTDTTVATAGSTEAGAEAEGVEGAEGAEADSPAHMTALSASALAVSALTYLLL